ncbi:MAG: hypothetical protein QW727_03995 [Candidatus Pacearchaeota archaeon]
MKVYFKFGAVIILIWLVLPLIYAQVNCNPSQIEINFTQGNPITKILSCENTLNSTINIEKEGNSFSIDASFIPSSSNRTININPNNNLTAGNYYGVIKFNNFNLVIPIFIKVEPVQNQQQENPQTSGGVVVFPTSKIVGVQQGQTKNQNIQIIVPQNYANGSITIQSVLFNPDIDIVTFGDLDLGVLNPGQTLTIPLKIDAKEAQTGTYTTEIIILATNSYGQINLPKSRLDINVQSGVTPVTNITFTQKPNCALSSTNMNLNQTYSFTCNGVQNNLDITPLYNENFEGISVNIAGGIYTYTFKPIKSANTNFIVTFNYKSSPVFSPFKEEVRITEGGFVEGTSLKLLFIPELDMLNDNEEVAIQLVDNRTSSLVNNPEIEINAFLLNKSGNSFIYNFQANKEYTIRARSPGYQDLVKKIIISPKEINYTIFPESGWTSTTFISINTSINATIFINGEKRGENFYGNLPVGINEIQLIAKGYKTTTFNITVEPTQTIIGYNAESFKKGVEQIFSLSKNASWAVYYQKDPTSQEIIKYSGYGTQVKFIPDAYGSWIIKSDGVEINRYQTNQTGLIKLIIDNWLWFLFGGVFLVILAFIFIKNKSEEEKQIILS